MSDPGTPKKTREPRNSKFTQQTLPSFRPVLEPVWVIFIFGAITIILTPIGAVCLHYGLKAHEVVARYDNICCDNCTSDWSTLSNTARSKQIKEGKGNISCTITLNITKDMLAPIYVYYEIDGLYQNHRRYVKSRDDSQLANTTGGSSSACSPQNLLPGTNKPIVPCGLIAWSFFNDSYAFSRQDNTELFVSDKGIAVSSDVKNRFSDKVMFENFNPAPSDPSVLNNSAYIRGGGNGGPANATLKDNERLIIWMRTAALPRFRKLWGKMPNSLNKGDQVSVTINNNYNTYSFDGKKSIVLGTTTWLGGHNAFLGIAYLVTGGVSFLMGLVYMVLWQLTKRKTFGNPDDLNATWNRPMGCL